MSIFGAALSSLLGDPNLGMDVIYRPASGAPIACRAGFAEPDIETQIGSVKVRDHRRLLIVSATDVAQPAKGDLVDIPAGGAQFRVIDFRVTDPMRVAWRIEAAI